MMKRCLLKLGVALCISGAALGCDHSEASWAESEAASTVAARAVEVAASAAQAPTMAPSATPTTPVTKTEMNNADEPPPVDVDAPLVIKRLVVARGVEHREPLQPQASFTAGETERIYAFVEVSNPERAHSEITVTFARLGQPESGAIRLRVGDSPRWRTWAYTRLATKPGKWQVIVRDAKGKELSRADFEVVAEADAPAA